MGRRWVIFHFTPYLAFLSSSMEQSMADFTDPKLAGLHILYVVFRTPMPIVDTGQIDAT